MLSSCARAAVRAAPKNAGASMTVVRALAAKGAKGARGAKGAKAAKGGAFTITINNRKYQIPNGDKKTVLQACQEVGVYVPYLCYHPVLGAEGHCRLCLVEIGQGGQAQVPLAPSCVTALKDGMVISTDTERVNKLVKTNLELLRARHPNACMTCAANGKCEFQDLCQRYNVEERFPNAFRGAPVSKRGMSKAHAPDVSSKAIVRDMDKCVLCGRCVRVCNDFQGMGVLGYQARGGSKVVSTLFSKPLADTQCCNCGQCVYACPVGALHEKDAVHPVQNLLRGETAPDGERYITVAQTAPAVRVAIGEELNMTPGHISTGKMVTALKRLGFDYVFDTNFTADLTIMEEGTELLSRVKKGGPFPMFTSCCPAWINVAEKFYPEFLPNLSTCKSPQGMMGAVVKTAFAERLKVDPSKIKVVSIMPCVAKKDEATRPQLAVERVNPATGKKEMQPDVDHVLTTRELGKLLRQAKVPFAALPETQYDNPLGESTGAAVIFGASGGVGEAALRTVVEVATGKPLDNVNFTALRGYEGIREATIKLGDLDVKCAIVSGLTHLHQLMKWIKEGKKTYHFVEVMSCPGGCLNGGGQPKITQPGVREKRNASIYKIDKALPTRKSHDNKSVTDLYKDYFGAPNSHKAHEHLHTHYTDRTKEWQ